MSEQKINKNEVEVLLEKNKNKFKNVMEKTLLNYSNMLKRMGRESTYLNFTLVYYSIYMIGISLYLKFFPNTINENIVSFTSIIASIVILVLSIIINSMKYETRKYRITDGLNKIKSYKRNISGASEEQFEKIKEEYYKVTDTCEIRLDIDYYRTLKTLERSGDSGTWLDIYRQKKEISVAYENIKLIVKYLIAIISLILPIALICAAFFLK